MSLNWSASALDLIAGLDRDALGQIARADARGAGAQRLDRHHHAAGEKHAGDEGEQGARRAARSRCAGSTIKRRIGFLDRRFDEHEPAERMHRRIGGQHLVAADVVGFLHVLAAAAGAGGLHLRELRHVGIAQHQADVGMGDQTAVGVDHISVAVLADLDARNHVPDQLEVDLGDAHAGLAPRAGERRASYRARIRGGNRPGRNRPCCATAWVNSGLSE